MIPHAWQAKVIAEASTYPKRAMFWSPRLGKTFATACMLPEGRSLIVAPLSVCAGWDAELASTRGLSSVRGYKMTLSAVNALLGQARPQNAPLILNIDKLAPLELALKTWRPQNLVIDESHLIKNHASARSKTARKLAKEVGFCRILTGTPAPNNYGDLWAQMVLVNPARWGSWTWFKNRFLVCDAIYPSKVIGHNNVPELQEMLTADADIIRREDVFGPDTWQEVVREVDLPPTARAAYVTLVRDWLYYHERGEVMADHALKRLTRLQQLTSGYLRTEGGEDVLMHTAKIDAVVADLGEIVASGEKAVIWHRFTWEGDQYEREIRRCFPGVLVGRISGATSADGRSRFIQDFASEPGGAIGILQTQASGVGVSFAEATHALFVSQSFSHTDETQARDRIYKPGCNRCLTFYRVTNSVDQFIAGVLAGKQTIHNSVTRADIEAMAYGALR